MGNCKNPKKINQMLSRVRRLRIFPKTKISLSAADDMEQLDFHESSCRYELLIIEQPKPPIADALASFSATLHLKP
jgi:hypothetical protein